MSHRNARLNFHGRRLLVERVVSGGRLPMSPKSRGFPPVRSPLGRPLPPGVRRAWRPVLPAASVPEPDRAAVEDEVVQGGFEHGRGQDWLGAETGVPARTVSRILRRHQVPYLAGVRPVDRGGDPRLEGPAPSATNGNVPVSWSTWT